ncbi:hypothetical protein ACJRO7_021477 [Eucalyptus globulus]|uniref:Uncharacterized protein n=1 Tax=Eucalyptus globulus TaxID=34317 RepID=A0ABD3KJY6_EUCGL
MAVSRSGKINGGRLSQRVSSRLIPRRGQVKVAVVEELAHAFAFIFSLNLRNRCASSH